MKDIQDYIVGTLEKNGKLPSKSANYNSLRSRVKSRPDVEDYISRFEQSMPFKDFFMMCRLNIQEIGVCIICKTSPKMFTRYNGKLSAYCSDYCSKQDADRVRRAVVTRDSDKSNVEKSKNKRAATMIERYGVQYNSQRESVKITLTKTKLPPEKYSLISDKAWLYDQYITQNKTFEKIGIEFGFDKGTIGTYLKIHGIPAKTSYNISQGQRDIAYFIESLGFNVRLNDRTLLENSSELDIVVESKNFAIEYDGLYYHGLVGTPTPKQKQYHQSKVLLAKSKGISLIRITEEEWLSYPNLIKSMIKARLGVVDYKISARKCDIIEVSASDARKFYNRTHIGGFASSSIYLALTYQNKPVLMCSFARSRFDKAYTWELIRLSSELDTVVVGGFQKVLSYFRERNQGSIMTYADCRYSAGAVYMLAGFEFVKLTDPGYIWTDGTKTYSRFKTQKSKLVKILKKYNPELTEQENMFNNRFRLYYDCGHLKFVIR